MSLKDWASFLRIDENKVELFRFLSSNLIASAPQDRTVLCAFDNTVSCNTCFDLSEINPCSQEEADTRIFLHIFNMTSRQGIKKVKIRTVVTDVVVLAISTFRRLSLDYLWIDFGTGKSRKLYAIHKIHSQIGQDRAEALLFFHAFTGCDQVSYFNSIGKKKAWKAWMAMDCMTNVFKVLSKQPSLQMVQDSMEMISRYTVVMYNRTSNSTNVNEARRTLFIKDGKDLDSIPPTEAALFEHVCRAAYVSGHIWYVTGNIS